MGKKHRYDKKEHRKAQRTTLKGAERLAWAKARWLEDPDISVMGSPDGMYQRMMERFGVAAPKEQLAAVKLEAERQVAREEARARRERPKKPFNPPRLVVATPEPEPEPEAPSDPPRTVPASQAPRPGTTKSFEDSEIRFRYAKALIDEDPRRSLRSVTKLVRDEYGIGVDTGKLGDYAAKVRGRRRSDHGYSSPARATAAEERRGVTSAPAARAPATPAPRPRTGAPEDAIRAAVQLMLEEVPELQRFTLERDENGDPVVDYELARVTRGSVKL